MMTVATAKKLYSEHFQERHAMDIQVGGTLTETFADWHLLEDEDILKHKCFIKIQEDKHLKKFFVVKDSQTLELRVVERLTVSFEFPDGSVL